MIPIHPIKEMNTDSFQLVGPHALGHAAARGLEVAVKETVGKIPHGQASGIDFGAQHGAVANQGKCGVERVGATAQVAKLITGRTEVHRLGKPPLVERQRLVGAKDEAGRQTRRDRSCLFPCQEKRGIGRCQARSSLDVALVDLRRDDLDWNSRCTPASGVGSRSSRRAPAVRAEATATYQEATSRRRSARSAMTAAAVSSIERRVTSMMGQLCLAHSRRENAISSATAWRST